MADEETDRIEYWGETILAGMLTVCILALVGLVIYRHPYEVAIHVGGLAAFFTASVVVGLIVRELPPLIREWYDG